MRLPAANACSIRAIPPYRKEKVLVTKTFVELLVCNARFHRRIEIAGIDLQDLVHPRKIDTHPASQCQDIAFQTSASTKRDQRHLVVRADLDDFAQLLCRLREGDGIRRYIGMIGRIFTMLLAYRSRCIKNEGLWDVTV